MNIIKIIIDFIKKLSGIENEEVIPVINKPIEELKPSKEVIPKNSKVEQLYPGIREAAYKFTEEAKSIDAYIFSGLRTMGEQAELYAQGRTKPGDIVTNAKPGYSYHNYGLAIDMVFGGPGKWTWNSPQWKMLGEMGERYGFKWGGRWIIPQPDRPHFQMLFGRTLSKLLQVYNTRKNLDDVWADLDAI